MAVAWGPSVAKGTTYGALNGLGYHLWKTYMFQGYHPWQKIAEDGPRGPIFEELLMA